MKQERDHKKKDWEQVIDDCYPVEEQQKVQKEQIEQAEKDIGVLFSDISENDMIELARQGKRIYGVKNEH